ncbi:hypothetical protein TSUD_412100 [Trifolium subterraneum]|uniref:Reverse transcriptase zinc-binding domain-containing protein n=1 Tax=Trifolium subterraneum TaxID=3900 RepID=A0A2Z6P436_TRISU|nr:hypothetical protein TSUD_412100 [Trifolium subterraneum]
MHDPWLRGSANRWVSSPQPAEDVAERILETSLVSSVSRDKYHVAGNWNGIWKAKAPHKAHHLLWHLCRGCLPTRYRLLERQVECTLNCHVCDEEIEDELHIFFRCAVARDSWCAAGLSSVLHNAAYQQTNAMDRIFAVCKNESSDTIGRVAMLLWCIWHNRNDKFLNDMLLMLGIIGWVKCNVDVAFVSGSGRTSVRLCFRDNSGQFVADMEDNVGRIRQGRASRAHSSARKELAANAPPPKRGRRGRQGPPVRGTHDAEAGGSGGSRSRARRPVHDDDEFDVGQYLNELVDYDEDEEPNVEEPQPQPNDEDEEPNN